MAARRNRSSTLAKLAADANAASSGGNLSYTSHAIGIKLAKNPLVWSYAVVVEGREFGMGEFRYGGGYWLLDLPNFLVAGNLDVALVAKGADNGTQIGKIAAEVSCDGNVLNPEIYAQTSGGFGMSHESYKV